MLAGIEVANTHQFPATALHAGLAARHPTLNDNKTVIRHIDERQALFYEGDRARFACEIVSGVVKLYKLLPDGRRLITGFFFAGDIIGLAIDETYACTAEAVTDAEVMFVPRGHLEAQMDVNPKFARRLLTAAFDELKTAREQMLLLGRKTPIEKVASFLLWIEQKAGPAEDGAVDLTMSRSDIADYLGLTVETVCRVMTRLKNEGAIRASSARHLRITGRGHLEAYADGDDEATAMKAA